VIDSAIKRTNRPVFLNIHQTSIDLPGFCIDTGRLLVISKVRKNAAVLHGRGRRGTSQANPAARNGAVSNGINTRPVENLAEPDV
jgi:hypothetical protein